MSVANVARCNPVKPPIENIKMNESPYNIGVFKLIEPLYKVANQLNTFTADGIDTLNVMSEKIIFINADWPDVNMW